MIHSMQLGTMYSNMNVISALKHELKWQSNTELNKKSLLHNRAGTS